MKNNKLSFRNNIHATLLAMFATVIVVRIFLGILYFLPINTSGIYTDQFHHYYLGLTILAISLAMRRIPFRRVVVGVGWGLIIDEFMLPFYLLGLWNQDYWSILGVLPILGVLLVIGFFSMYVTRKK